MSARRLDLAGRVALVTGAAQGIGRCTASLMQARGATPVCLDLPGPALESLREALGAQALVLEADVTDAARMREVVEEAVARLGRLDVVVANAGIERVAPTIVMPPEEFERVLDVNIRGVYRTVQPALPHVVAAGGHVLSVSSVSALVPWPLCAAYGASKAFVGSFMRSLRVELSGTGASAGCVYFGFIRTDMMQRSTDKPVVAELFERTPSMIVSRRPLTPEQAAEKIVRAVERRQAVGYSHFGVRLAMWMRGIIEPMDDITSRDLRVPELIERHFPDIELPQPRKGESGAE